MSELGTPIKCIHCGRESTVRLKKGIKLAELYCVWCDNKGFKRWTSWDKLNNNKITKFQHGKKYRLLTDFNDEIYGIVPKDSVLTFLYPNLGYAKFRYNGNNIAVHPKLAFEIFEEENQSDNSKQSVGKNTMESKQK